MNIMLVVSAVTCTYKQVHMLTKQQKTYSYKIVKIVPFIQPNGHASYISETILKKTVNQIWNNGYVDLVIDSIAIKADI